MAGVVLVDSGGANLGSVLCALQRLGVEARVSGDGDAIRAATHVILPGVGAAPVGMARLRERGLVDVVRGLTRPVLGVCLGMHLLFEHSDEGDTPCLGLLPGRVRKFSSADLRIPHMGWNALQLRGKYALLGGIGEGAFAYFVHSFAAPVAAHTLAACDYGGEFAALVQARNFFGAQFHPERSAQTGARLLQNFLEL